MKEDWAVDYNCTQVWYFPKISPFPKTHFWSVVRQLVNPVSGQNNLVPVSLVVKETMLKIKKSQEILSQVVSKISSAPYLFKNKWKLLKVFLFWKKNSESFHKCSPAKIWLAFSDKFVVEYEVRNSTSWKISNAAGIKSILNWVLKLNPLINIL